jgi:hypothetical protein
MEEKSMYQISNGTGSTDIAIPWSSLPDELISKISGDYYKTIKVFSKKTGCLEDSMVIYFRKVKKFRKGIVPFELPEIIFGVE